MIDRIYAEHFHPKRDIDESMAALGAIVGYGHGERASNIWHTVPDNTSAKHKQPKDEHAVRRSISNPRSNMS